MPEDETVPVDPVVETTNAARKKRKKRKAKAKSSSGTSAGGGATDGVNEVDLDDDENDEEGYVNETITTTSGAVSAGNASSITAGEAISQKKLLELIEMMGGVILPDKNTKGAKDWDSHKFWNTQPVPKNDEHITADGPIEGDKDLNDIQKEPYPLLAGFEWCTLDITKDSEIKEVYELLSLNYVEDDDAGFRFDYSAKFLKWALQPPGWKKVWHLGVRVSSNKKLVAFISAIPAHLMIHDVKKQLVEINFLCVHKKLRSKRLAPVLIKEITRLVNLEGTFQAVYTAGTVLPKAISTCRYYHRSINPKKLIETGFSHLSSKMTMAQTIKLYRLPEKPALPGTRPMEPKDVPFVASRLRDYLSLFDVAISFSEDEARHWLLPLDGVVCSCVVEDPETKEITDFYSIYSLPSTVIGNTKHTHVNAAYLFYYFPKGFGADSKRLQVMIKDALILARDNKFDVLNCLELMQNDVFLNDLHFGKGDGFLHYYLYNYRCRSVPSDKMGLVML